MIRIFGRHNTKRPGGDDGYSDLLAACKEAREAMKNEWLYQTGQFCRPKSNYPQQGSCHGSLSEAIGSINKAVTKAERAIKG